MITSNAYAYDNQQLMARTHSAARLVSAFDYQTIGPAVNEEKMSSNEANNSCIAATAFHLAAPRTLF